MTCRSGTLRIAKKEKEKEKGQGIVQLESPDRENNCIEGSTDQKKEPVVHELWASDIALEGLLAILSGQAP